MAPTPPRSAWRAKYTDPDNGAITWTRIDPLVAPNERARRDWAIAKAKEIAQRADALEHGATRKTGLSISDAVDRYFKERGSRKNARTQRVYRDASNKLSAWCASHGIASIDDLGRPALVRFVASLESEPRRSAVVGGKRGTFAPTGKPRAAATVNREIRAVRTVLGHLRVAGLAPRLTGDDIADSMKQVAAPKSLRAFLRTNEIRASIEAALRSDAETHTMTREEHMGLRPVGTTPRYEPVAPFALTALLTGARLSELLAIEWEDVQLDERDRIRVRAEVAKTKRERSVDLAVSPSLRELFEVMAPKPATGLVFGLSREVAINAASRLRRTYDAPAGFSWQACRRTCSTYLVCAPGIYGGASHFREAKRLGHSVTVAEQSYAGVEGMIPVTATTLEAAMAIEDLAARVIEAARARGGA